MIGVIIVRGASSTSLVVVAQRFSVLRSRLSQSTHKSQQLVPATFVLELRVARLIYRFYTTVAKGSFTGVFYLARNKSCNDLTDHRARTVMRIAKVDEHCLARHCPGQHPPFLAVKRLVYPYKSAIQNRFTMGNTKGAYM